MTDPITRTFKVTAGPVGIHLQLGGPKVTQLAQDALVEVDASSRTEHDGQVWWRNAVGWSPEKSLDGTSVLMTEITQFTTYEEPAEVPTIEEPAPQTEPPTRAETPTEEVPAVTPPLEEPGDPEITEPALAVSSSPLAPAYASFSGKRRLIARDVISIRKAAGLQADTDGALAKGQGINADFDTVTLADSYYWIRHDDGWSAIQDEAGADVMFDDGGEVVEIGTNGPNIETLPGYRSMITRSPVDLDKVRFFQYFGNNVFAWQRGHEFGYPRYSQALHGGLDFGNTQERNIPVYAGISGTYRRTQYSSTYDWNHRLEIDSGEYVFIYQHTSNFRKFEPGQAITPDTVIADIYNGPNWADHLHFEVRFQTKWIVNPLALMNEGLYNLIIDQFDPEAKSKLVRQTELYYFFKNESWQKWYTPLDQPVIELGGTPIGPRYV